jgi:hypothetical protein
LTSDDVYRIILYAVGKNKEQGYVSPQDFYIIINKAQSMYFDYLLGEYQKYQVGRPIAVVSFAQNEKIRTSLAPLIYGIVLNAVSGIAPFPNNFQLVDAMWSLYGNYNIRFAQQDSVDSYVHSVIDPIAQNPVYIIQHEGFHFYPETTQNARMSYVSTPPSITWGFIYDSNGVPVYDPTQSQQPIWSDYDMIQIIIRALQLVGLNLQLNTVVDFSREVKQLGQ